MQSNRNSNNDRKNNNNNNNAMWHKQMRALWKQIYFQVLCNGNEYSNHFSCLPHSAIVLSVCLPVRMPLAVLCIQGAAFVYATLYCAFAISRFRFLSNQP